jgi:hypothetical protein
MILMLKDSRPMSSDELRAFLRSSQALGFTGQSREQTYAWIENTLRQYRYLCCPRSEKGVLRRYLQKMSGFSPAQLTRLIARFRKTGQVRLRPYRRHRFPTRFTREDQLLLAEVDEAHGRISGPATLAILKREYALFGRREFARLSTISVAHLYNLRQSTLYRRHAAHRTKTQPTAARYGERRRPDPQGQPGYLRVDTVHQGDRDGEKGVYHLNTIDEVTQWQILGCVERISERYLIPVLQDLLAQYPFTLRGFHSDNGGEFINQVVAQLLDKLLIEFTKSRSRRTNDQALVEGKNGSIVRKQMGYGHIPQSEAQKIQQFYQETLNVYLNFHRPCGFATEVVDQRGKVRKHYETYLTPFEKFKSLPGAEGYLRPGVTLEGLEEIAQAHSDTEYAQLLQQHKAKLFRSFASSGTLG